MRSELPRNGILHIALALLCLLAPLQAKPQKADKRLDEATEVLKAIATKSEIPHTAWNKAKCVLIFPSVKKVGIGIGMSYGRGVLVCRTGANMDGNWGAPMMYTLDTGSLGAQFGSSATDYVLLIISQRGADKILSGKLKLGADASAVAGPAGANVAAFNDPNIDILSYSQSKGLFAGASLGSASIASDDKINAQLYNKDIDGTQVLRTEKIPPAAQPLIDVLKKVSGSSLPYPTVPTSPITVPPASPESGSKAPNPPPPPGPPTHTNPARGQRPPKTTLPSQPIPTDDEILEKAIRELKPGTMAYNTPEKMKTGQTAHVIARIAPNSVSAQALTLGMPADNETKTMSTPITIKMKTTLTGADFDIVPLSSEEQIVGGDMPTTWEWDVVPKHSGKLRLHLAAKVELRSISRDITTVDKEIIVQVDPIREVGDFLKGYWPILTSIGTVLGGLVLALWRRRKKPSVPD